MEEKAPRETLYMGSHQLEKVNKRFLTIYESVVIDCHATDTTYELEIVQMTVIVDL